MDVKRIGDPHQHAEERRIVDRFTDLCVSPSDVTKGLDLFVGDAIGVAGQGFDKLQQTALPRGDRRKTQVAVSERLCGLGVFFPLQLQEPSVGAESIVAAIYR